MHTHTHTYVVRPIYERSWTDRVQLAKIQVRRAQCRPIICMEQNRVSVHASMNSIHGLNIQGDICRCNIYELRKALSSVETCQAFRIFDENAVF